MTTQTQQTPETEVIIRFSHAWWIYMIARGGILRAVVNGLEDTLAITGRTLLLVFLLYCGVKSGALLIKPDWTPDIWLEMSMFVLQLAGLEGSIPGLARHADVLRTKNDHEGAKKVEEVMRNARIMTILTIGEGVLHVFNIDSSILRIISGVLLLIRGIVITSFLIELAKIDAKGPRVLSRAEHERDEHARQVASEQGRMISGLRMQLEEALADLSSAQQKAELSENEQAQTISQLREQVRQLEQAQASLLTGAEGQDILIRNLQDQLTQVTSEKQTLTAQVNESEMQVTNLTSKLQRAEKQVTDLTSKLKEMTSSPSGQQEVKMKKSQVNHQQGVDEGNTSQGTVLQFVPKLDGGRRKHNPLEVKAWCEAHAHLSQAEQAAHLGISDAANLRRLLRRARELEETGQAANAQ